MRKRTLLALLMLSTAVGTASPVEISAEQLKYDLVEVILITHQERLKIMAEVADTRAKTSLGLMHRNHLAADAGMLFVFQDEQVRSFWMKNTLIPLDIIFVSKDLRIMHIARKATPCEYSPCKRYSSVYPIKYVVEINGGLSKKLGLIPGDYIELDLSVLMNN